MCCSSRNLLKSVDKLLVDGLGAKIPDEFVIVYESRHFIRIDHKGGGICLVGNIRTRRLCGNFNRHVRPLSGRRSAPPGSVEERGQDYGSYRRVLASFESREPKASTSCSENPRGPARFSEHEVAAFAGTECSSLGPNATKRYRIGVYNQTW